MLISKAARNLNYNANPFAQKIGNPKNVIFQITDTKLCVPIVTLSKENDAKSLEQLKAGFKRTIKWTKYSSQITVQPQNNNLSYLTDPKFSNVNRLFVLSFVRTNARNNRDSFSDYYVSNVEIKDFNVLINPKTFWFASKKWRRSLRKDYWNEQ